MEECNTYFELDETSPYMLLVARLREEKRLPLHPGYENLDLFRAALYHLRSEVPPSPTWTIRPASRRCTKEPTRSTGV